MGIMNVESLRAYIYGYGRLSDGKGLGKQKNAAVNARRDTFTKSYSAHGQDETVRETVRVPSERCAGALEILSRRKLEISDFYKELRQGLEKELDGYRDSRGIITTQRTDVTGSIHHLLYGNCLSMSSADRIIRTFLAEYGVPEDVTFAVDYDNNNRTFMLSEISDETYREQVQTALDDAFSVNCIFNVTRKAAFLSGNVEEYFYSLMRDFVKDSFGQDINDLWLDEKGNIQGINAALAAAMRLEASSGGNFSFMGMGYNFGYQKIGDGLRQLLSMPECHESVTRMVFDENGLYMEAGELQMGRVTYSDIENDEKLLKLYYYIGGIRSESYNFWLSDYDAFK